MDFCVLQIIRYLNSMHKWCKFQENLRGWVSKFFFFVLVLYGITHKKNSWLRAFLHLHLSLPLPLPLPQTLHLHLRLDLHVRPFSAENEARPITA